MRRQSGLLRVAGALFLVAIAAGVYGIALLLRTAADLVRLIFRIPPKSERGDDHGAN